MTTIGPARFSHTDLGTAESSWLGNPRWDDVRVLDAQAVVRRFPRALVASAHPDDETLGVGGLVADLDASGMAVEVLVATDGERSHPASAAGRDALAARRRAEVVRAVARLAPGATTTHLGLPDTGLDACEDTLVDAVRRRSDPDTLVLAPWTADGHGDHDALGRACAAAAAASGATVAFYPVWLWHWAVPEELPWADVVASEPSREAAWRKRAALGEFPSQTSTWVATEPVPDGGAPAADGASMPVVGGAVLDRARRLVETLLDPQHALPVVDRDVIRRRTSERAARFDSMYDGGTDPWALSGSFYEDRRRALLLTALGRPRYARALEVGCADGRLTEALVGRCDEVVALDTSRRAVVAARERAPRAQVSHGAVPGDLPAGPFDLVVLSEVGYFLTPLELLSTLRRAEAALGAQGELVLCHWQHPTEDIPLDGALVHEQAATSLGLPLRASYVDDDVRVEVWGCGPSPAVREGRA